MVYHPTAILILILCLTYVCPSTELSNSEATECSKFLSSDFYYGHFYKISELKSVSNGGFVFEFEVKTPSDAHIKFSERPFPSTKEAAYEVVIGAGRNTFSYIRRKEVELSKIRLDTPGILSSEEKRGFWIMIDKLGNIEVGKKGEVYPFMQWEDGQPLVIKYFSFSSWENISAEWDFNCTKTEGENDRTHSKYRVSKLARYLFAKDYDIQSEPPINPDISNYTNVHTHLSCNHVDLDDRRSILVVDGVISMFWEDRRMVWPPEEYGNKKYLDFLFFPGWTPRIKLHNFAVLDLNDYRKANSKVIVYSNGTLFLKYNVHFVAFCKGIDHHNWPKDKHQCELQLGLMAPHSTLQIIPMKDGVHVEESSFHTGWDIERVNFTTKWIPSFKSTKKLLDELNPESKNIIIEFSLTRTNNVYFSTLKITLAATSILTLLSFWASPLGSVKVGLQCFSLVTASLTTLFCWKIIPVENSKNLPSIFSAFIILIHMAWISIASSVILSRFIFLAPVSIPSSVSGFLKSKFLAMFFCLPQPSNKVAMLYNRLCDEIIMNKEDTKDYSFKSKECESQWNWILISTVIERILFCAYIGLFFYAFSLFN